MDRLAFSVLWEMTQDLEVIDIIYTKSVIHSRAALRYEDAQHLIDGTPLDADGEKALETESRAEVTVGLRELMRIAKVLRKRRYVSCCIQRVQQAGKECCYCLAP